MLSFARPWWLIALIIVPLFLWYQFKIQKPHKLRLPFTRLPLLKQIKGENKFWKYLFPALRSLIFVCLILAIAQPRWGYGTRDISQKGVDIVLAIDISGSMLAMDFAPQ
ncbi:MAG TPA: BatA domain-containing protein, partial [Candidatus Syntrophosphaera thermopropionivorans]|nr:BatA domain-containing protein [Candidatus Syntrophosphaera thermopropionivorans]